MRQENHMRTRLFLKPFMQMPAPNPPQANLMPRRPKRTFLWNNWDQNSLPCHLVVTEEPKGSLKSWRQHSNISNNTGSISKRSELFSSQTMTSDRTWLMPMVFTTPSFTACTESACDGKSSEPRQRRLLGNSMDQVGPTQNALNDMLPDSWLVSSNKM